MSTAQETEVWAQPELPKTVDLTTPDGTRQRVTTRARGKGDPKVKWDPKQGWVVNEETAQWVRNVDQPSGWMLVLRQNAPQGTRISSKKLEEYETRLSALEELVALHHQRLNGSVNGSVA
jgi:hypothetical protein